MPPSLLGPESYCRMKTISALIVLALFSGCAIIEEIEQEEKLDLPIQEAPKTTEYHYTGKFCADCHQETPVEGGDQFLKYNGDFDKLCKCHVKSPADYIHPVDFTPTKSIKTKIPSELPLRDGKLTCLTCHDIYRQCQKRRVEKISLRGAPFPNRSDFCFKCHDKKSYVRLDAHNQRNAEGAISAENCLYCHTDKPNERTDRYEDVKLIGGLEALCQRCHVIRGNHAGNFNHMVKPSAKALNRMKSMETTFGIVLPLDENGKMTCITCHNPHDKGVIPAESPASKGAGSKFRHRLPGRLCIECHQY